VQSLRSESAFEMNRFVAENSEALAQAQSRHDDVAQSLVKANARVEQTRLTAPLDGVVQQVVVTTVGQVVTTGQPLMIIVPQGATLEAEALVQNRDIGFIEPGQRVTLKLDAFPFTRYGTLTGRIARVSSDAVSSREAAAAGDPTVAALHLGTIPSVTDSYVYTVTIVLDSAMMVIDGRPMLLTPGMSATAQIRTGERRLLEYFLGPLLENASNRSICWRTASFCSGNGACARSSSRYRLRTPSASSRLPISARPMATCLSSTACSRRQWPMPGSHRCG
jgi:hemolysin D